MVILETSLQSTFIFSPTYLVCFLYNGFVTVNGLLFLSVLVIVEEIILKGNFGGIFLYLSMILVIVEALFDFSFSQLANSKNSFFSSFLLLSLIFFKLLSGRIDIKSLFTSSQLIEFLILSSTALQLIDLYPNFI